MKKIDWVRVESESMKILKDIPKFVGIGLLKTLIGVLGIGLIFLILALICVAFVWIFTGFGLLLLVAPDLHIVWKFLIIVVDVIGLYFIGKNKI